MRYTTPIARLLVCAACAVGLLAVGLLVSQSSRLQMSRVHRHSSRSIDPQTSCGPVSLAVVSRYLDRPVSISEYNADTHAGDLGVCSMADLVHALKKHGFAAVPVRYDGTRRPPPHSQPMILYVNSGHFMSVFPSVGGRIVIVDPPSEPKLADWSDLLPHWKGEAVVVGRSETDLQAALAAR
jgi:ABC-type bacteriocin/lantibiotic exporter with double-glycine peptidase domain